MIFHFQPCSSHVPRLSQGCKLSSVGQNRGFCVEADQQDAEDEAQSGEEIQGMTNSVLTKALGGLLCTL